MDLAGKHQLARLRAGGPPTTDVLHPPGIVADSRLTFICWKGSCDQERANIRGCSGNA
jgi:hypothetical protein